MTTVLTGPDEVRAAVGTHLGFSDWLEVSEQRVRDYTTATGDTGRSGIVPEYLVLAFSNLFLPQIVRVDGFDMGVNYGVDTVRFPSAAPVGARLRGAAELVEVTELPKGLQTLMRITVEVDGATEPACVIDSLSRWFP